jgi:hypothetical protein
MTRQKYDICPICGNNRQNYVCLRCAAIDSSRRKRWRTGDRGGVRPERRTRGSAQSLLAPPATRKSKRKTKLRPKARSKAKSKNYSRNKGKIASKAVSKTYSKSNFTLAIVGEWINLDTMEPILIDVKGSKWRLCKKESKRRQEWKIVRLSRNKLLFLGRAKTISARIARDGSLILQEGSRQVPFAALIGGKKHRTCKHCFVKIPWTKGCCSNCLQIFA